MFEGSEAFCPVTSLLIQQSMLSEPLVSDLNLHALEHALLDILIDDSPTLKQSVCDCKVVRFDCLPHVVDCIWRQGNHIWDTP